LFVAGISAYRALPDGGFVARSAAATIYIVNPFVYGRLHYGQLYLLVGYAILPWVAIRLRRLLSEPRPINAIGLAASLLLVSTASAHLLLAAAVLATTLVTVWVALARPRLAYLRSLVPQLFVAGGLVLGASAYWIFPLLTGRGSEGERLTGIGSGDLSAFAAVPDQHLGLIPNLLGLYGFWAENTGRFTSMKAFVPAWPAILALLLLLSAVGLLSSVRKGDRTTTAWVAGLLLAASVALFLEMGISHPVSAGVVGWLDANVPAYRGMRDAGKWAALLAFAYSQMAGLGAAAVLGGMKGWPRLRVRSEWLASFATALILAVPLYYGNGLLYGAHSEIRPSEYPAGWYSADRVLRSDAHSGRTLFIPWHEYMSYSFIHNQNRVVAPPAPNFFSVPIVVSNDPEVTGIATPHTADQDAISSLVRAGSSGQWAEVLNERHIKYVLLARELDWSYFAFLDAQPGLSKVADFGSIVLYRNVLAP